MFERFKSAKRLRNADKAAAQIVSLLASSLYFARNASGTLDSEMQNDYFVLAYVYGAIGASVEALGMTNQEEIGYVVPQVFERIFPDNGRRLAEVCNLQAAQKEKAFLKNVQLGLTEMAEVLKSNGQSVPKALLDHVTANYHAD